MENAVVDEVERLREELDRRSTQVEMLTKRVLAKDREFAQERARWQAKVRTLERVLKARSH